MITRPLCLSLARATLFFRAVPIPLHLVVVVYFNSEMTVLLLGVMTALNMMIVVTSLMIVMATIGVMIDMAAVVATVEMIEMAITGEMTGSIVIAVMIGPGYNRRDDRDMQRRDGGGRVVVAMDAHLLVLLILVGRFAKSMGTLHVIVGGVILILMMMMMRIALAMRRAHMELIPTGIWTLVLQITSRDN
jgi:hypothetical protein